jgi:osmotically-inducible protein OsmY
VVENGNVTLSGVVLSQLDKQLAGTTAAQIAGAFSITNNLQVEEVPDGSKS